MIHGPSNVKSKRISATTAVNSSSAPMPVVVLSKAWICGRMVAGTLGSNPADKKRMFVSSVSCILCRQGPFRRADYSLTGGLWVHVSKLCAI